MQKENKTCDFNPTGKVVFFATNNIHKFEEARQICRQNNMSCCMLRLKGTEIQSDSLCEIASESAAKTCREIQLPVIVEDAGLFVESLNGFPGPYAAYAYKTLGNEGIIRLLKSVKNRKAKFQSVIAYCDTSCKPPECFDGEVKGKITAKQRKTDLREAFGFDPIFQPLKSDKTFAEMPIEEKNTYSHRAMALRKFISWYKNQR